MTRHTRLLAATTTTAWLALAACRSGAPPTPPTTAPAPPATAGATQLSHALRWARDSAEHRAIFLQVYAAATRRVEQEATGRSPGNWAVVLDADETVIDNSRYQVERERAGLPFDDASWGAWVARREAVPLPGAGAFLARVRELGGKIAIVTNRTMRECPDTEAVFRAYELPYDVMLCKPDRGPSDKNPRFEKVAQGKAADGLKALEIVAFVGDNIHDFPNLSQAVRKGSEEPLAPFGTRYFLLPNPMYGSWERN